MKKSLIMIIVVMLLLCGCSSNANIKINSEDSFFSDFEITDGTVYFSCTLSLSNLTNHSVEFSIAGDFSKDKEGYLVTESLLYVCDSENKIRTFSLGPNETESFQCSFVGIHGGAMQKANRLLPDSIVIKKVS